MLGLDWIETNNTIRQPHSLKNILIQTYHKHREERMEADGDEDCAVDGAFDEAED